MKICRGCCGHLGQRWKKNRRATRGRIMGVRPTQSREGVKGGTSSLFVCPLQGQGTASLVGFGATPQLLVGRPMPRKLPTKAQAAKCPCQQLCASADAPPSKSYQLLCFVAPNGRDHTACLPPAHTILRKTWAPPHNSAARLPMSFPPSAACKFLDLPPVNLRNLHLHLTKNPFVSRLPHLCGVTLAQIPQI